MPGNDGIDLRYKRLPVTGGVALSYENNILSLLDKNGYVLSSVYIESEEIQKEVLPEASEEYEDVIFQYIGENGAYTNGYFYKCVKNISYTTSVSFDNIISCDGDDFLNFIKRISPSDFQNITNGTMTYSSLRNIWRFVGKNSSNETIATYQQYTEDFENEGFVFTGTYNDGDVASFTCVTVENISYSWVNIKVQDSYSTEETNNTFVKIDGTSVMTGNLQFKINQNAPLLKISPRSNTSELRFFDNNQGSQSITMDLSQAAITPLVTGRGTLGTSDIRWNNGYINNLYSSVITLENEENERHIKFKKSNDDTIRGLITNRYVPNSLVTLSFSSFYNTGKSAEITMLAGERIKSVVSVTAEKNDAATGDTDIHLRTIATQGWVNNPEKSLNVVHRSGDEEISGRKDFLNDITAPNQLDYTNISNCITEIPQNIKLELNNGVLTLKSGSKLYVPNGAGVFDIKSTTTDKTISSTTTTNGQYLISCDVNNEISIAFTDVSGQTTPSTPTNGMIWFDTTNSIIKRYWNGTWYSNYSLPIASVTVSNGTFVNIDQVFNGFGYIGSTVFALPGVKGFVPDGRNEDGSLKNVEFALDSVKIITNSYEYISTKVYGLINKNKNLDINGTYTYDEKNNICYNGNNIHNGCYFCTFDIVDYKITNFQPKTVFHAVDYNDFNEHRIVAFQQPTSKNNYTWYRLYSDGWVEQGGIFSVSVTANTSKYWEKTLPIPMSNANYTALVSHDSGYTNLTQVNYEGNTSTIIKGYVSSTNSLTVKVSWQVSGMSAN